MPAVTIPEINLAILTAGELQLGRNVAVFLPRRPSWAAMQSKQQLKYHCMSTVLTVLTIHAFSRYTKCTLACYELAKY